MKNNTKDIIVQENSTNKDSTLKGVLIFIYVSAVNLTAVAFNLGYWVLEHNHWTENPSVAELFLCLCNLVFIIVYTVKCFRQNLIKQLRGITCAFAFMALGSFVVSGIFFPVFIAGEYVLCYLIKDSSLESMGFIFVLNVVVLGVFAFVLFLNTYADGKNEPRKKPYLLTLKQITAILSAVCACFLVLYGFALAKYEFDYDILAQNVHTETPEDEFLPNITQEQRSLYNTIKCNDFVTEVEKTLTSNGFEKQEKDLEEYLYDNSFLPFSTDEYILNQLKNTAFSYYLYSNEMYDADYEYDDTVSCIIIAYDESGKINYKMFIPSVDGAEYFCNYSQAEEVRKWFDSLQKGEKTDRSLEFIRNTNSCITEDEKFNGNNTLSLYTIEFDCYYLIEPQFTDLIFYRSAGSQQDFYVFEVTSENGIITDFKQINN